MASSAAPKVVLIGNSSVGKTSIFQRLQGNAFNQDELATVGGSFSRIKIRASDDREMDVNLWDTAGEERFRGVVPMYFSRSHAILVVYDVTCRRSFDSVSDWVTMAQERAPEDVYIILVGNKMDLDQRAVTAEEGQLLRQRIGAAASCECSAKTGEGIDVIRVQLAVSMERASRAPAAVTPSGFPDEEICAEGAIPARRRSCC